MVKQSHEAHFLNHPISLAGSEISIWTLEFWNASLCVVGLPASMSLRANLALDFTFGLYIPIQIQK